MALRATAVTSAHWRWQYYNTVGTNTVRRNAKRPASITQRSMPISCKNSTIRQASPRLVVSAARHWYLHVGMTAIQNGGYFWLIYLQVNQKSFNKKLKECRDDSCKSKGTRWDDSCKSKGTRWDDTCKSKTRPSEPRPTLKCQVSYISGLS